MATELLFVPCGGLDELLLSDIFKPVKDEETCYVTTVQYWVIF